jgi:hypothetical protein
LIRSLKAKVREAAISAVEALDADLDRRLYRGAASNRPAGSCSLLPSERRLVEALADSVLPSDSSGPGAREADVAGALDRGMAASPERRALYGRGLAGIERLARRQAGRSFADLPSGERTRLLEELDRQADRRFESPLGRRIPSRLTVLYYRWRFPAVDFLQKFTDDVFEVFYTSPVSWQWLGYDGPPMPHGYLDPTRPRT